METDRIKRAKIAFIGAGNMAEALVNGILAGGIVEAGQVTVADIDAQRLDLFRDKFCVEALDDNCAAVAQAGICVLAVKPQTLSAVLEEVGPALNSGCLVISIAAGIRTGKLEQMLGESRRVVRAMPNTPALVGMGAAALCPGAHASAEDMDTAEVLLGAVGKTVRVEEGDMDAVTALSGSGPAYVFLLMEQMIAAGIEMGLSPKIARELTGYTVEGAVRLMLESGAEAADLRERVTSKGGTTAAALEHLEKEGVGAAIVDAIKTARDRSQELAEDGETGNG